MGDNWFLAPIKDWLGLLKNLRCAVYLGKKVSGPLWLVLARWFRARLTCGGGGGAATPLRFFVSCLSAPPFFIDWFIGWLQNLKLTNRRSRPRLQSKTTPPCKKKAYMFTIKALFTLWNLWEKKVILSRWMWKYRAPASKPRFFFLHERLSGFFLDSLFGG